MKINLVLESKSCSTTDFQSIVDAVTQFVPMITKAWSLFPYTVTSSTTCDPEAWNVIILDTFPNPAMMGKAYGYHEAINGLPIAYIRANSFSFRPATGLYKAPIIARGKAITKERMADGLATVVMHEIAEMLVDPFITERRVDGQSRPWILEICDHTKGLFKIVTKNATVVAPDFTNPAFYDIKGIAPLSHCNVPLKPFTLVAGAYGYWDNKGAITAL
jgi:hypothetical protein